MNTGTCFAIALLAFSVLPLSVATGADSGTGSSLVGTWREKSPTACQTATGDTAAVRLAELVFKANGEFSVTWMPFETYKDYWGTYRFDPATRILVLKVDGGNYTPADARLRGPVHLAGDGTFEVSDMIFGTPHNGPHVSTCPLVFTR
jgi:hypothetical protein